MNKSDGSKTVAIVGSGPVGLSLALGLARAGIRSIVVEKKEELDPHSRATFIHAKTLEIFAQWKVLDEFLQAGSVFLTCAFSKGKTTKKRRSSGPLLPRFRTKRNSALG